MKITFRNDKFELEGIEQPDNLFPFLHYEVEIDPGVRLYQLLNTIALSKNGDILLDMMDISNETLNELNNDPLLNIDYGCQDLRIERYIEAFNTNFQERNFIKDSFVASVSMTNGSLSSTWPIDNEVLGNLPVVIEPTFKIKVLDNKYKVSAMMEVENHPTLFQILRAIADELAYVPLNKDKDALLLGEEE